MTADSTPTNSPMVTPTAKASMKTVQSNSSVSTMAPQDWDLLEDDTMDSDDLQWHPAATTALEPVGEEQDQLNAKQGNYYQRTFQHARVPRSQDLAAKFSKASTEAPATTMMIRNIPNRYNQRELIKELENLGFAETFDFFYAPIDTGTMGNVGYAFVNFIEQSWAERCCELMSGYTFKKHQHKMRVKVASVSVAHIQGLEANLRHYENAAVNGRARAKRCGPVIMTSIASALV